MAGETRSSAIPRDGKLFVAANPWPLAAQAKREGYETDRFRESDFVADDTVYVIDLDKVLALPEDLRVL